MQAPGGIEGTGSVLLVNHNTDHALATLRYRFPQATFEAAEEPFEAAGKKFNRGSFLVTRVDAGEFGKALAELGVRAYAVAAAPAVKVHPSCAPPASR